MNPASHPTISPQAAPGEALSIRRFFTTPGVHPFDTVEWEMRNARIGHGDRVAFEQENVEFPKTWSQNATNIVAQKYFRGQLGSPEREHSVKEMIGRVAGTITGWGRAGGYFAGEEDARAFNHELTHILLHQMAAFNSPVWFNVGFEESPQCSACFILSVEDTMESILDLEHEGGDDLPRRVRARASTCRTSAARWSRLRRVGRPPVRCRSCAARTPGPARSSRGARPAGRPRWWC